MTETPSVLVPLEPCPFCGSAGETHTHPEIDTMHIAGCSDDDCIAHQVAYDFVSRETAVAAWNTRAMLSARPDVGSPSRDHDHSAEKATPQERATWLRAGYLLYTLEQIGWRKGKPVEQNRLMVQISGGPNATAAEVEGLLQRVLSALSSAEQVEREGSRDALLNPPLSSGGGEDRMREALEPFAKAANIRLCGDDDHWTDEKSIQGTDIAFHIKFGDLRRARAALVPPPPSSEEDGKYSSRDLSRSDGVALDESAS